MNAKTLSVLLTTENPKAFEGLTLLQSARLADVLDGAYKALSHTGDEALLARLHNAYCIALQAVHTKMMAQIDMSQQ